MASPPNTASKASGTNTASEACEWPMTCAMFKWLGELYWLYHLETISCNRIPHKAMNQSTLQDECGTQDESIPAIHPSILKVFFRTSAVVSAALKASSKTPGGVSA